MYLNEIEVEQREPDTYIWFLKDVCLHKIRRHHQFLQSLAHRALCTFLEVRIIF